MSEYKISLYIFTHLIGTLIVKTIMNKLEDTEEY